MTLKEDIMRLSGLEAEIIEEGKFGKALAIGATILALSAASALGGAKVYQHSLKKIPATVTQRAERKADSFEKDSRYSGFTVKVKSSVEGNAPVVTITADASYYFDWEAKGRIANWTDRNEVLWMLASDIKRSFGAYLSSLETAAKYQYKDEVKTLIVKSQIPVKLRVYIQAKTSVSDEKVKEIFDKILKPYMNDYLEDKAKKRGIDVFSCELQITK